MADRLTYLRNHQTTAAGKQAYEDALTALAPETAPAVQQAATEGTNQIFGAVGTRLSGGAIASAKQGMSSGDNPFTKVAVWVQGLFNKAKLDDTSKSKGFDSKTYGTALGVESKISEDVKLGIGYAYSKTDIDGFMRDTDVKTHTAILYGEYKPKNWYVNAIASYGWSDYDEKKNVAGVGVKADWDVEPFALQMMTGYDNCPSFKTESLFIKPVEALISSASPGIATLTSSWRSESNFFAKFRILLFLF